MSSSEIRVIEKDIVHRICSGQVVLNLATAIKELVENSLDAHATAIEVRLVEYGSELIEVVDNGSGIHPDNFQALTLKHHTSKLNDFSDLVSVETFGFRGEALSSLCAMGSMTITTKHGSEKRGTKLMFDCLGGLQSEEPYARQTGTTVTLTNLFSSLPVRQKELHRNLKKEFNKALQLLTAYCLIATNVKIMCVNQTKKGGKSTFLSTQNNKNIRDNISCVFGCKQLSTLLEIISKNPDEETLQEFGADGSCDNHGAFILEGFISSCEHGVGRSSADRQFYFVNSRPCEPSKIVKLVNEIYRRYNQHQFPFVLMNIVVAKEMVDVNVTPDKRSIFLQNEKLLRATIKCTLTNLFENIPSTYKINENLSNILLSSGEGAISKLPPSSFHKWRCTTTADRNSPSICRKRSSDQKATTQAPVPARKQLKIDYFENTKNSDTDDVGNGATNCVEAEMQPRCDVDGIGDDASTRDRCTALSSSPANTSVLDKYTRDDISDLHATDERDITCSEAVTTHDAVCEKLTESDHRQCDHIFEENVTYDTQKPPESFAYTADKGRRRSVIMKVCLDEIRRIRDKKNGRISNLATASCHSVANKFHAEIDPSKNHLAEEELAKAISKDLFLKMKVVGQFNLGFIISKLGEDLFIIDQHASDEKYNFETLQTTTSLKCQKLVAAQNLDLTAANEHVLIDNVEILRKNGFEFSIDPSADGTKKVKLVSIPVSHNWQFGKEDIDEMLFMLQDAPHTLCRPSRIRAMFASRACRKSVMIGTPLSIAEMRKLIIHMSEIEHPWNCPHGRPTMRHLINLSLLG